MADEIFRQKRTKATAEELNARPAEPASESNENPLDRIEQMQRAVARETGKEMDSPFVNPAESPFQIGGNIPQAFREAMQNRGVEPPVQQSTIRQTSKRSMQEARTSSKPGSDELESLLEQLASFNQWEEIELPSKGKFYTDIPGKLHIRPMTGEEEQVLATARFVKKGKSIDMLFARCLKERIDTEQLLSIDRTFLLIYLRGISHTPEYDAEITCRDCGSKFHETIDLNSLEVDMCPEDFGNDNLTGVLPTTGWKFQYRLATGSDEVAIRRHHESMVKEYGDEREDDTLLFRTATLLDNIEGVKDRNELVLLIKKMPVNDVAYLRHTVADQPFGVNTELGLSCPSCFSDFEIELPVDAYFFFPRKKTGQTHQ